MPRKPSADVLAYQQRQERTLQAIETVVEQLPETTMEDVALALLSGQLSGDQVARAVKRFLRTDDQRGLMYELDLDMEDIFQRRYAADQEQLVLGMFDEWNKKMGVIVFASTKGKMGDPYPAPAAPAPVEFGYEGTARFVNSQELLELIGTHYGAVNARRIPGLCGWQADTMVMVFVTGMIADGDARIERFTRLGTGHTSIAGELMDDLARKGVIPTGTYLISVAG